MAMRVFFVMAFMNRKTVRQLAVFCLSHFSAERSRQSGLLLRRQFLGQGELKLLEQSTVCTLMEQHSSIPTKISTLLLDDLGFGRTWGFELL